MTGTSHRSALPQDAQGTASNVELSPLPETRLVLVGIKALYGRIATHVVDLNELCELVMELLLIYGRESTKDREPKILGLRVG